MEVKEKMTKRIIPCLDTTFDEQGKAVVVKGIEFEKLRYAGDPVETVLWLQLTASGSMRMLEAKRWCNWKTEEVPGTMS